jgi:nucleoid-associated protein YgaU
MSVATELVPTVSIPARARLTAPLEQPEQWASVTVLHPPVDPGASTVRLTRRGIVVLAVAVLALGVALVWLAKLSAPQSAAAPPAPHSVTVQPGDTLWSIASQVAPDRDPRAEVAALQQRNHLTGVALYPGQVLRVP